MAGSLVLKGLTVRNKILSFSLRAINRLLWLSAARKNTLLPKNPKRILIANIANLGDVVIATTVLPALKRQFPNAEFGFLVASWAERVAQDHPDIQYVHIFDHFWRDKPLVNHIRSARRARKEILGLKYDIAIDLHPYFPNAIPLLYRSKIPHIMGYTTGGFDALLTHPYSWSEVEGYMGQMHLCMLQKFGIDTKETSPHAYYPKPNVKRLYIVAHMGTSKEQKEWNRASWIELIGKLQTIAPVVLTGNGIKEIQECEKVAEMTGAESLAGKLDWGAFTQKVQGAKLVVTVDSVTVHVAAAVQVPTVVVFSGVNSSRLWVPDIPVCKAVMRQVACAPCYQKAGCSTMHCIRGVTAKEVFDAALVVLNRALEADANICKGQIGK